MENQKCCTSLRYLIKETLLRDRKRRKKSPAPGGNRTHCVLLQLPKFVLVIRLEFRWPSALKLLDSDSCLFHSFRSHNFDIFQTSRICRPKKVIKIFFGENKSETDFADLHYWWGSRCARSWSSTRRRRLEPRTTRSGRASEPPVSKISETRRRPDPPPARPVEKNNSTNLLQKNDKFVIFRVIFLKDGPLLASFSLFSSFLLYSWLIKLCRCLDSNRGSLVSEATALPTEPQPLPKESLSHWCDPLGPQNELFLPQAQPIIILSKLMLCKTWLKFI